MNIFIGNLNLAANEDHLRQLFIPFGGIESVKIITDFNTGLSRGFGFVEMKERADGETAVKKLNDTEFMKSVLSVSEATQKPLPVKPITIEDEYNNPSRSNFKRRF